jgi:molybdopterin-containing oxidoreductase family iron-sulfur binding subunit
LNELEGSPEFESFVQREFPVAASEFPDGISRRRWLQLMSASLALGGFAGCRYQKEEFAALVARSDQRIAGVPLMFATSFEWANRPVHLLVGNVDGRPIKLEGNPQYPLHAAVDPSGFHDGKEAAFAMAGTDAYTQACILSLYDPDRCSEVLVRNSAGGKATAADWDTFERSARQRLEKIKENGGASLVVYVPPTRSPSVRRMLSEIKSLFPQATIARHSMVSDRPFAQGIKLAAGRYAEPLWHLEKADVICSLDSDIFANEPASTLYARQYSARREPDSDKGPMNRMYVIEGQYSMTGASADSRLTIPSSQIGAFALDLEKRIDAMLASGSSAGTADEKTWDELDASGRIERTLDVLAGDLVNSKGKSAILVGRHQPAEVQAVGWRINQKLGNIGATVELQEIQDDQEMLGAISLREFADKLTSGSVQDLWILGGNPVYGAPTELDLAKKIAGVEHSVYLAEYVDETAQNCRTVVPATHPLESWGDVLGCDGSYAVGQPQILPLLNGKSVLEVMMLLVQAANRDAQAYVRSSAGMHLGSPLSDQQWRKLLHDGFLESSAAKKISINTDQFSGEVKTDPLAESDKLEVVVLPSESTYDGRFANNGWLQEMPQAVSKLVWDNAALVSPVLEEKLRLKQGEMATIRFNGRSVDLPIFVVPGINPTTIVTCMGYGRKAAGNVGTNVGHDVTPLLASDSGLILSGAEIAPTSRPYKLATTQDHFAIDTLGQNTTSQRAAILVREGTYEQYKNDKEFSEHMGTHHPPLKSLWTPPDVAQQYAWAMTIDLNKCIGCNSCVVACQAENNVPIVGKEQVSRGREMHWLRLDRYFKGDPARRDSVVDPKVVFQPVACVQRFTPKKASMRWPTTAASELVTVRTTVLTKCAASITTTTTKSMATTTVGLISASRLIANCNNWFSTPR